MINYTMPNLGLQAKLDLIGLNLDRVICDLFVSPTSISDTLSNSQLVKPSYDGYIGQIPTGVSIYGGPTISTPTLQTSYVTFSLTATIPPTTIAGVWWTLVDGFQGAAVYQPLAIALLPGGPQVMSQVGDTILSQLTLTDQRAAGQP